MKRPITLTLYRGLQPDEDSSRKAYKCGKAFTTDLQTAKDFSYFTGKTSEVKAVLLNPLIIDAYGYSYGHLEYGACEDPTIHDFLDRCRRDHQCVSVDDIKALKPWCYDSIVVRNVREMTDDHSPTTDVVLFSKAGIFNQKNCDS